MNFWSWWKQTILASPSLCFRLHCQLCAGCSSLQIVFALRQCPNTWKWAKWSRPYTLSPSQGEACVNYSVFSRRPQRVDGRRWRAITVWLLPPPPCMCGWVGARASGCLEERRSRPFEDAQENVSLASRYPRLERKKKKNTWRRDTCHWLFSMPANYSAQRVFAYRMIESVPFLIKLCSWDGSASNHLLEWPKKSTSAISNF